MPPPTSNPESLARATVERPGTPGAIRSPEQMRADRIREQMKSNDTRATLEAMRRPEPIDKAKTDQLVDDNVGTERDATGAKMRSTAEQIRFTDLKRVKDVTERLIENGYGSLNTAEQVVARRQVEQALRAWPAADNLLSSLTPGERDVAIADILKNPDMVRKMRDVHGNVFNPDNALPDLVTAAQKDVTDKEALRINKNDELNDTATKLTQVSNDLARFNPGGVDQSRIDDITLREQALATDLQTKQQELAILQAERAALNRQVAAGTAVAADVGAKEAEIFAKNAEIRTITGQFDERDNLVQKKTTLTAQKATLDQNRVTLTAELTNLDRDLSLARADLATKMSTRVNQEQEFLTKAMGLVSEATMQYMEDKVAAAEQAERQVIDKQIAETDDEAEKTILKQLLERWERDKTSGVFRKSTTRVYDKTAIDRDFKELISSGDPKLLLQKMLSGGALTPAEIADKLADQAFVDKMQPQVIERLLASKLSTGKLTEADARTIFNSPWGTGMIDAALKRRDDLAKNIADLASKDILEGSGNWLAKNKDKISGGLLLKILALIALGAIVAFGPLSSITGGAKLGWDFATR